MRTLLLCLSTALMFSFALYGAEDIKVIVRAERHDALYKVGDQVDFKIRLTVNQQPVFGEKILYSIGTYHGDGSTYSHGEKVFNAKTATVRTKATKPGFIVCQVKYQPKSGNKPIYAYGAAGVEVEKIKMKAPEPTDFEEFWLKAKQEVAAVPMQVELTPVPEFDPLIKCFNVKITCAGGRPVSGYLAMPKSAKKGSLGARVNFHGAGVRSSGFPRMAARHNMLIFDVNAHGIINGQLKSFYKDLKENSLKNYYRKNWGDPQKNYFRGMYMRIIRALEFIKSRPEWNGKTLIVSGHSQGGAQAIAAAGLDSQVTALVAFEPALCNVTGNLYKQVDGWPRPLRKVHDRKLLKQIKKNAGYFDVTNFAKRIKNAECFFSVGFDDTTCSASSVYTAFNAIPSAKKSINNDIAIKHYVSDDSRRKADKFMLEHLRQTEPANVKTELLIDSTSDASRWLPRKKIITGPKVVNTFITEFDDPQKGPCLKVSYNIPPKGSGQISLRCLIPEAESFTVKLRSDKTVSFYMRIIDRNRKDSVHDFKLKGAPGWQTFTFNADEKTFKPKGGFRKLKFPLEHLRFGLRGGKKRLKGEFYIAGLTRSVIKPESKDTIACSVITGSNCGIYYPGEKAKSLLKITNRLACQRNLEIVADFKDDSGKTRQEIASINLPPYSEGTSELKFNASKIGFQQVVISIRENNKIIQQLENAIAIVLPATNSKAIEPGSFFGMHHSTATNNFAGYRRAGIKVLRISAEMWQLRPTLEKYSWGLHDEIFKAAQDNGLAVMLTVIDRYPWAPWKNEWILATDKYINEARKFRRELFNRYKGKFSFVEMGCEVDLGYWTFAGQTLETAVNAYSRLLKETYRIAKEIVPGIPVVGLSVSSSDVRGGYVFTRAALPKCAPFMDVYGPHPYSANRLIAKGRMAEGPEEYDLAGKMRDASKLLLKYGKKPRIWVGELGWELQLSERPLSHNAMLFGAITTQAIVILKSIPEVEKYFAFTLQPVLSDPLLSYNGNSFAFFRGTGPSSEYFYPTPAISALATASRLLDYSRPVAAHIANPTLSLFRFDRDYDKRTVFVLWARENSDFRIKFKSPVETKSYNMLGQTIADGVDLDVSFSKKPIYFEVPMAQSSQFEKSLSAAKLYSQFPVIIRRVYRYSQNEARLLLVNTTSSNISAKICLLQSIKNISLKPGENIVSLDLSELSPKFTETKIKVQSVGRSVETRLDLTTLKITNDILKSQPLVMNQHKFIYPPDGPWKGVDDLSVSARFAWDKKGLRMQIDVKDDHHRAKKQDVNNFLRNDAVAIAIDMDGDSGSGFDNNDRMFGFVLGSKGPAAYLVYPNPERKLECDLTIVRDKKNKMTLYKAFIPWKNLKLSPPAYGKVIALNFAVIEDDRGWGRSHWMEFSPGLISGRSPMNYKRFIFVK